MKFSSTTVFLAFVAPILKVQVTFAHGELKSPRSRNWYAHEEGIEGLQSGKPSAEYCPHCLNTNPDTTGVCGESTNHDYNAWLDTLGDPMPWISQETYTLGQTIVVESFLTAHHGGHMELKACPVSDTNVLPPQSCLIIISLNSSPMTCTPCQRIRTIPSAATMLEVKELRRIALS